MYWAIARSTLLQLCVDSAILGVLRMTPIFLSIDNSTVFSCKKILLFFLVFHWSLSRKRSRWPILFYCISDTSNSRERHGLYMDTWITRILLHAPLVSVLIVFHLLTKMCTSCYSRTAKWFHHILLQYCLQRLTCPPSCKYRRIDNSVCHSLPAYGINFRKICNIALQLSFTDSVLLAAQFPAKNRPWVWV